MNDVFISYKVHNRKTAIDLYHQLKNNGFIPWFDQLIPKGTNWSYAIRRAIQTSHIVLCLISQDILKDDWVYRQIKLARKYRKKIIFLLLEDVNIQSFKKFKISEAYTSFAQIPWDRLIPYRTLEEKYIYFKKKNENGRLRGFYLAFVLMAMASYQFCFGFHFFNIHLEWQYGFLPLGVLGCILLSYVPNRKALIGFCVGALIFLAISVFVYEPFYIWNISINPIVFLIVLLPCFFIRFFRWNGIINFIIELLWTILVLALTASSIILFENLYHVDVFYISFILLAIYLFFLYQKVYDIYDDYETYRQFLRDNSWKK